jgi:hypothetical protein
MIDSRPDGRPRQLPLLNIQFLELETQARRRFTAVRIRSRMMPASSVLGLRSQVIYEDCC